MGQRNEVRLQVLGVPAVVGATGEPARCPQRCMELMWAVMEHPGASSAALAEVLGIARTTVKTVAAHLRRWVGEDVFPTNTTGEGYRFAEGVTSDWHTARRLVPGAPGQASTAALCEVLEMVTAPPFAGAFDWATVDLARSEMTDWVVMVAVEVARRAADDGDHTGGRWALSHGLLADPNNEELLAGLCRVAAVSGRGAEALGVARRLRQCDRRIGLEAETAALVGRVRERFGAYGAAGAVGGLTA